MRSAALLCAWCSLLTVAACAPPSAGDPSTRIANERSSKDQFFRSDRRNSPIREQDLDKFLPLSYFPIDEAYTAPAQLEPVSSRAAFTMPTSAGKLRTVERVGTLRFTMQGQPLTLAAFLEEGTNQLFVPFSDLTSGSETYPAGRYLYLDPTRTGIYIVDFNTAYHPYCYYNDDYDCPLPPAENRLKVPIRAGERLRAAEITASAAATRP